MSRRNVVRTALALGAASVAVLATAPAAGAQTPSCQGPLLLGAGYWTPSECTINWTCQKSTGCRWRPVSGASLQSDTSQSHTVKAQSRWTLVDKNPLNGVRAPVSFGQSCMVTGSSYVQCQVTQALMVANKGDLVRGACWAPALLTLTLYFRAYAICGIVAQ